MAIKLGTKSYYSKIHIVSEIDYFRQTHSGINHKAEVNLIGKAELIELAFYVRAIKLFSVVLTMY